MSGGLLAQISAEQFWQATFTGFAVGAKYSLIALGFVIIFRATGVINFAQGSFVVLGAYFAFNFTHTWGMPFYSAMLLALVTGALVGIVIEAVILRHLVGEQPFTVIMITIGLLFVLENVVTAVWGQVGGKNIGAPWGLSRQDIPLPGIDNVSLADRDLWGIVFAAAALVAFFLFFKHTRMGLAMRATAQDEEATMAQGVNARHVYRTTWAMAGVMGALAGIMLTAGPNQLNPHAGEAALLAFPAIILGGLDSPLGAVVGGFTIGLVQQLTALYQPEYAAYLGDGFEVVAPYLVMIIILMVRPYGLFGTPEVRRV